MKVGVGARLSVEARGANDPFIFTMMEKASTRAFSWLKVSTRAFTFKTLLILRHYAKRVFTHGK